MELQGLNVSLITVTIADLGKAFFQEMSQVLVRALHLVEQHRIAHDNERARWDMAVVLDVR